MRHPKPEPSEQSESWGPDCCQMDDEEAHDAMSTATAAKNKKGRKLCECGQKQPTLGVQGSSRGGARWCLNCPTKPADAVNVNSRKCECGRSEPSLGVTTEGRRHARWCARCPGKPRHAVNVVNKRCECGRCLPSLGLPGDKKASWCAKCPSKPHDAVNVVSKKCVCGRGQPSLGLQGQARKDARWCSKCPDKPPEAVNVVSKKCACGKGQPSLGMPGEPQKRARWCAKCPTKPPEAVNTYSYHNNIQRRAAKAAEILESLKKFKGQSQENISGDVGAGQTEPTDMAQQEDMAAISTGQRSASPSIEEPHGVMPPHAGDERDWQVEESEPSLARRSRHHPRPRPYDSSQGDGLEPAGLQKRQRTAAGADHFVKQESQHEPDTTSPRTMRQPLHYAPHPSVVPGALQPAISRRYQRTAADGDGYGSSCEERPVARSHYDERAHFEGHDPAAAVAATAAVGRYHGAPVATDYMSACMAPLPFSSVMSEWSRRSAGICPVGPTSAEMVMPFYGVLGEQYEMSRRAAMLRAEAAADPRFSAMVPELPLRMREYYPHWATPSLASSQGIPPPGFIAPFAEAEHGPSIAISRILGTGGGRSRESQMRDDDMSAASSDKYHREYYQEDPRPSASHYSIPEDAARP